MWHNLYYLRISVSKILVSTGDTCNGWTSKSGIITIQSTVNEIKSTYEPTGDYFAEVDECFSANCDSKQFIGGGWNSQEEGSDNFLKKVFVFEANSFVEINPLNHSRGHSSAVVLSDPHFLATIKIPKTFLCVTGGYDCETVYDTIEYLEIDKNFKTNSWRMCQSKLPSKLHGHQVNIFADKIIVSGGCSDDESKCTNNVWEGTIRFNGELSIEFKPLPPMFQSRSYHASTIIKDKLYCLGGYDGNEYLKSVESFCFATRKWKSYPDLHCTLSYAKVVSNDKSGETFIIGGRRDGKPSSNVSLYDPITGMTDIQEGNLDTERYNHVAVLM